MGWFSKNKKERQQRVLPWQKLTSINQLTEVIASSHKKPVLLFKHSTRCSISSMIFNDFQQNWTANLEEVDLYCIDLLNYRDVSNAVEQKIKIIHQSPQVIVLKNKEVIYTATHSSINAKAVLNSIRI